MIIKRIAKGIKNQDWFVVAIEIMIVIVGIFIGLQVDDWNEERVFHQTETELLYELKHELQASILLTEGIFTSYKQAAEAGRRSLNFLSSGTSCDTKCWPILIDFLHASQWQSTEVRKSTYENMRLLGMPSNRAIIDAVESYLLTVESNVMFYAPLPYYRSLVRRLIPLEIQEYYSEHCYHTVNGLESYNLDCPKGVADELTSQTVKNVVSNSEVIPHLTEWTSSIISAPTTLGDQNITAQLAISLIDVELELR
ncbi:MAG: hypothetical protein ACI9IA_000849 [Enterobacterales bacterium]